MSNITKNWFYKLSEITWSEIQVEDNLVVSFFDDWKENKTIILWKNSKVEFYWFLNEENNYKVNFIQKEEASSLKVRYLLLSKNDNKLKAKIYSKISSSFSSSDVKIMVVVLDNWFVDLDWIIEIDEKISKVNANLLEENLFLWDSWKIKWVPTLLVRSNDVKASHACRIERISDEKLFYLRSRWIWKESAINMMIEAYVKDLFSCISMLDNNFYEELVEDIFNEFV